jgi:O-antigen/teichoic acid export membrane protein
MTPIIQVLALMSIVKPLSSTTSALFQSTGHPGYNFRAGLAVSVIMVPGILLLVPYGPVGAAFAVFVAHVVGLLYNVYQVQSILPKTALRMVKAVMPAMAGSTLMGGGMWLSRVALTDLLEVSSPVGLLVVMFVVGLGIYTAFVFRTQGPAVREILELIKKRRRGGTAKGVEVVSEGSVKQP